MRLDLASGPVLNSLSEVAGLDALPARSAMVHATLEDAAVGGSAHAELLYGRPEQAFACLVHSAELVHLCRSHVRDAGVGTTEATLHPPVWACALGGGVDDAGDPVSPDP